jgi:hypothetical protein
MATELAAVFAVKKRCGFFSGDLFLETVRSLKQEIYVFIKVV